MPKARRLTRTPGDRRNLRAQARSAAWACIGWSAQDLHELVHSAGFRHPGCVDDGGEGAGRRAPCRLVVDPSCRVCCIQRGRVSVGCGRSPWSHGQGEFGEGIREAQVQGDVRGEFVVAAAKVLHERMAGRDPGCRAESFESAHRPQPGLEPPMISFYPVVAVLRGDMRCRRDQFVQHPQVGCGLVGGHLDRRRPRTPTPG